MSKLPIVSGAECIKALEKIGFSVYRPRVMKIDASKIKEAEEILSLI